MDNWSIPVLDLRPVIPGKAILPSWPMDAQEVTAEDGVDGGTFFRPEKADWINGTHDPNPSQGDEGSYFLNTTKHEWWGPRSADDEDGNGEWPGPVMLPGDTWVNGAGEPEDVTGAIGNSYLDTTNHAWWGPKSDTWEGTGPHYIHENWIDLEKGPLAVGEFSIPASTLVVSGADEEATADVYLELADIDGSRIGSAIEACTLTADGGSATATQVKDILVELDEDATIAKARWRIEAGKGLAWSAGGELVKLR